MPHLPDSVIPWELLCVQLGDRFHKWPWEFDEQDAERALYYLAVLGAEGEARAALAGVQPGETFIWEDDDG